MRREKGEGRREKGEGRREKGEGRREKGPTCPGKDAELHVPRS